MTQLEMALAAQENPWQDLLWFDWHYCECEDDDDDWGDSDSEWLRSEGVIDADGNLADMDYFDIEV